MSKTLYAIGEVLIDFIPSKVLEDSKLELAYIPKLGGAPANVLGAYSKLGGKTELLTQLGNDLFGRKILDELKYYKIGTKNITFTNDANTALAFVDLDINGERSFSFYRNPSADMLYDEKNISLELFDDCFAFHFCSVSIGEFPMKYAHKKAIEILKNSNTLISFDVNLRFSLWNDKEKLYKAVMDFIKFADIIKVSNDELTFITGYDDIEKGCKYLLKFASLVICTCGSEGAYAFTKQNKVFVMSNKVKAIDTTGAGDAFIGSFLYNLCENGYDKTNINNITQKHLTKFISDSNLYCEKSVQKIGAIDSYPSKL